MATHILERVEPVRAALGRIPSGVFIVTAGEGARAVGTMVSLVQQISLEPACVEVALKPERSLARLLREGGVGTRLVINVCHAGDKTLLRKYAKASQTGAEAFAGVRTRRLEGSGGTVLLDACAYLECELRQVVPFGADHDLYIVQVTGGGLLGDGGLKPVVHVRHDGGKY